MIRQRGWTRGTIAIVLWIGCLSAHAQQTERFTTIDDLFKLIEVNNRSLRAQKTGIEMAREAINVAKNERLPDVSTQLSASYLGNGFITDRNFSNYTTAPIPHFGNNFALEASQIVYSGGALTSNICLAELAHRQTEISVVQNKQRLCFIALGQYLDLYKTRNQMTVYRQHIELTNRLIANVRAKHQQGTALKNDITRYEFQLENLKLELVKLKDNYDVLNYQLCNTAGLPHEVRLLPDTTLVSRIYNTYSENYWQKQAITSALSVKQAVVDIDVNKAKEKIQQAERLPKVSLILADYFDGPITIEVPAINKNFNYWYVGIGVRYNLDALYKSKKKIKQAQLQVRQSIERQSVVNEQLENAVQAGYTEYLQSFIELKTQQKSVELAQQNYQVVNDRYLNQLALITDMIDAFNTKLSAELQEVNARIGIVYTYYKMKYIAGTL